jgi:hypothetical protein
MFFWMFLKRVYVSLPGQTLHLMSCIRCPSMKLSLSNRSLWLSFPLSDLTWCRKHKKVFEVVKIIYRMPQIYLRNEFTFWITRNKDGWKQECLFLTYSFIKKIICQRYVLKEHVMSCTKWLIFNCQYHRKGSYCLGIGYPPPPIKNHSIILLTVTWEMEEENIFILFPPSLQIQSEWGREREGNNESVELVKVTEGL